MKQWIIWVGGSLVIALLFILFHTPQPTKKELRSELQLFYDLQDTIRLLKNKDKSTTAQIKLLEADKNSLSRMLAKTNKSLSELLKKGATSASVINTKTVYDTINTVRIDTVNNKPYFLDTTVNHWANIRIELKDDSLHKSFVFKDSISVAFKKVNQKGLFKSKKSVVEVTTYNPYVKVDGVRSFDIIKERKRLFWAGVAIGGGAVILLNK